MGSAGRGCGCTAGPGCVVVAVVVVVGGLVVRGGQGAQCDDGFGVIEELGLDAEFAGEQGGDQGDAGGAAD